MRASIALLAVAAVTLAAGACGSDRPTSPSTPEDPGQMPVESFAESASDPVDPAKVVATVDLEHGGVATFLDLGDGAVAIAERAPVRARFVTLPMLRDSKATPLELYLALRPDNAEVPRVLLRDQERLARSGSAAVSPRILNVPSSGSVGLEAAVGYYGCQSPGNAWIAGWKAEYAAKAKYRAAAYFTDNTSGVTFYPGAPVYYGTNTNSITYLGACNADAIFDLWMEVHRRIGGKWVKLYGTSLFHDSKHLFYSGIPASYRGMIEPLWDGSLIEDFGIGAAWTLSPPVSGGS